MAIGCGIVGLPNVGKSTIFNALTAAKAPAANFPFTTIDPHVGVVRVPDPRLDVIAGLIPAQKLVPASVEFVDIAGLVKGASKGEGLGNQFQANIRETNAVAHVVRCFEDPNIIHVSGSVDPERDVAIIDTELMLADLETVTKRYATTEKTARSGNKEAILQFAVLSKVRAALDAGRPVRSLGLDDNQMLQIRDFHLITAKPLMYVANVGDADGAAPEANAHVARLKAHAAKEGAPVVALCGKIESEVAELPDAEKTAFLKDFGMDEPGLNRVIRTGYELLGLITFIGNLCTRCMTSRC